jgi:hypothetical protein
VVTRNFRAARRAITGHSWLDDLERASLSAAEAKFSEEPEEVPALLVSLLGIHDLDAYFAYVISKAVQDATAKIGHVLRDPKSEVSAVYASDREKARLVQRGQSGGMIIFGFPDNQEDSDDYLTVPVETLAERAVRELLAVLPSSDDDDASLDAVLAQRPTVRNAVNDIVNAVPAQTAGLDFRLMLGSGERVDSVLSAEQAAVLKSSLSESRRQVKTVTRVGRLDGVRTKRRIFYLELDSGKEIHGAVDIHQLEAVRQNLDREVVVTLQEERVRTLTGRRGHPYYRLISLQSSKGLFG